jgi:hypothetical protein
MPCYAVSLSAVERPDRRFGDAVASFCAASRVRSVRQSQRAEIDAVHSSEPLADLGDGEPATVGGNVHVDDEHVETQIARSSVCH